MLYYSVTLVKLVVIISFNANNKFSYVLRSIEIQCQSDLVRKYKMCRLTVQATHKCDAPRAVRQFEYFTTV